MARVSQSAANLLEDHQLYVLENFTPCLIPKMNQGRIGQAQDSQNIVNKLSSIRDVPEILYPMARASAIKRFMKKLQGRLPDGYQIKTDKIKDQLDVLLDEVYDMSDLDFKLAEQDLKKKILSLIPGKRNINIGIRAERFLLNPEIIPLLVERIYTGNPAEEISVR